MTISSADECRILHCYTSQTQLPHEVRGQLANNPGEREEGAEARSLTYLKFFSMMQSSCPVDGNIAVLKKIGKKNIDTVPSPNMEDRVSI